MLRESAVLFPIRQMESWRDRADIFASSVRVWGFQVGITNISSHFVFFLARVQAPGALHCIKHTHVGIHARTYVGIYAWMWKRDQGGQQQAPLLSLVLTRKIWFQLPKAVRQEHRSSLPPSLHLLTISNSSKARWHHLNQGTSVCLSQKSCHKHLFWITGHSMLKQEHAEITPFPSASLSKGRSPRKVMCRRVPPLSKFTLACSRPFCD